MAKHESFTPDLINNLKPTGSRRHEYHSANSHPGLMVFTSKTGNRSFQVQWSKNGSTERRKLEDIGGAVEWDDIHRVWQEARRMRKAALRGEDPVGVTQRSSTAATISEVYGHYVQSRKFKKLRRSSQRCYIGAWECYVLPTFGQRSVQSIKLVDLTTAYSAWTSHGTEKTGSARTALMVLKNVWNHAERYEYIPDGTLSPFKYLNEELEGWGQTKARQFDVSDEHLPKLWSLTYALDVPKPLQHPTGATGAAIRFMLATGLRLSEVQGLRWDEIDMKSKTLHLPAARVKTKRDFIAPLNTVAMRELYSLKYTSNEFPSVAEFVFGRMSASFQQQYAMVIGAKRPIKRRKEYQPASDLRMGDPSTKLARIGREVGIPHRVSSHQLRKTFARIANEAAGFYATKKLLNHAMNDVTSMNYLVGGAEPLRQDAERVGELLLERLGTAYRWTEPSTVFYRVEVLGH